MRGRIRDHQRGEPLAVFVGFLPKIVDVDVALGRARDDDDAHAGHRGARRIGSVSRRGNQHDVRAVSPRSRRYARMTIRPANSPCAPELGCSDTAANPVISQSIASSSRKICWYPSV